MCEREGAPKSNPKILRAIGDVFGSFAVLVLRQQAR
jgi:hypothetical protein